MNKFQNNLITCIIFLLLISNVYAWRIPDTGQVKCYNDSEEIPCPKPEEDFYGQDGNYIINPQSYILLDSNGNSLPFTSTEWIMVKDNITDFVWEAKKSQNSYTQNDFNSYISQLNNNNYGSITNWKIPSIIELLSIANHNSIFFQLINENFFPNHNNLYLSSTVDLKNNDNLKAYDLLYGTITSKNKGDLIAVSLKDYTPDVRYIDNEDSTFTDILTGLMWELDHSKEQKNWKDSLNYCEQLSAADYSDWRMPNHMELLSIIDVTKQYPAVNEILYKYFKSDLYWTSTTIFYEANKSFCIDFNKGDNKPINKTETKYVIAVRAGQKQIKDNFYITSPEQTSTWVNGETMNIEWDTINILDSVKISISYQGGKNGTYSTIVSNAPNNGAYSWTISAPSSYNCMLKIEPVNYTNQGNTLGLFTIISSNEPPNQPKFPIPSDTSDGIPVNYHLSWQGGDPDPEDLVYYDIYFGTTNPPELKISNYTSTTYPLSLLKYNTKYYWKIVSKDHELNTDGQIWSFTTIEDFPPSIEPISDYIVDIDQCISIPYRITDLETDTSGLTITITVSNQNIFTAPYGCHYLMEIINGTDRYFRSKSASDVYGTSKIQICVTDSNLSTSCESFTITVMPVIDGAPEVTYITQTTNIDRTWLFTINPNYKDGDEVQYFKITEITNGTLFQNNGLNQIFNNVFITNEQGKNGLLWIPSQGISLNGSFRIQAALDNNDESIGGDIFNAEITGTKLEQTISYTPITNVNYGDPSFYIQASSNANLPLNFSNNSPDTIEMNSNQITITNAGNVNITISQMGNGLYQPANPVYLSFTINKKKLIVKADDKQKNYYDNNPMLTYQYTGFIKGENKDIIDNEPEISTNAFINSIPGKYQIQISGGNDNNYSFEYLPGTLTVNKASQIINFSKIDDITYGDSPILLNANSSSGMPVTFINLTPDTIQITDNQIINISAGEARLKAIQPGNNLFHAATPVELSFIINKKNLHITANNIERSYSSTNPSFPVSYSGFVHNDNIDSLKKIPLATSDTNSLSIPGEYSININGGLDENYSFIYHQGILTITKAKQIIYLIEINDKIFGDSPFELKATSNSGYTVFFLSLTPDIIEIKDNIATILDVGTGKVNAYLPANSLYETANSIEQSITITKKQLRVIAENKERYYGCQNPDFTIKFDGFIPGHDKSVLNSLPYLSSTAALNSSSGNYTITLSGGSDDQYYYLFQHGILTILPANIDLIFPEITDKTYGDQPFKLNAQITGKTDNELPLTPNLLENLIIYYESLSPDFIKIQDTNAIILNASENVIIKACVKENNNFQKVDCVKRSFKINKKQATIQAQDIERNYKNENPDFIVIYKGFVNGDTKKDIDKIHEIECSAELTSQPGEYDIIPAGAEDSNYTFTYIKGTLTIVDLIMPVIETFQIKNIEQSNNFLTNDRHVSLELNATDNTDFIYRWYITESSEIPTINTILAGSHSMITEYTIESSGDGEKNLFAWVMDKSENISNVKKSSIILDTTKPEVLGISDVLIQIIDYQWSWYASEDNCLFRFSISQKPNENLTGEFSEITTASISKTIGQWYLHVEAKDEAGNISEIKTSSIALKKPKVEFDTAYSEFYEYSTNVNLKLTLSHAIDQDVSVDFRPILKFQPGSNNDIATIDKDFKLVQNAIIKADKLAGYINIEIIDDNIAEFNEEILIELIKIDESNFDIGILGQHNSLIINDDKSGITITQSNYTITEKGDPQKLTVSLNSQPEYDVEIILEYDERFIIEPHQLCFKSNEFNVKKEIIIQTYDDNIYKGDKIFNISFKAISDDDNYNELYKNISLRYNDDDPIPGPPKIKCPDSPNNQNRIQWCWSSGGGTRKYRYKINDPNLDDYATETGSNCYKPLQNLPDDFYTFYIHEYNEYTDEWSDITSCEIEIDTGKPCSKAKSPESVDIHNAIFEITYEYDDVYDFNSEKCFNSNSGSGLKKVELWAAGPNDNEYQLADTDTYYSGTIDGKFEYNVTNKDEGKYRFIIRAIDNAGNYEYDSLPYPDEQIDSQTFFTKKFSGIAIIAVGTVSDKEGLDSHTLSANNIYKHLINRHFGLTHDMSDPYDHIKYYNPNKFGRTGVDEFFKDDNNTLSYERSLQEAIENWTVDKMSKLPAGPVYIILINHGMPNTFYLSDDNEKISSKNLKSWIENMEKNFIKDDIQRKEIVIVIDTCYSGSFIDDLSAPGRIIITSSDKNELSYRGERDFNTGSIREGAFFASNLFNELSKGENLADSFVEAVKNTEKLTYNKNILIRSPHFDNAAQHPLIDDNGDGICHNDIEYSSDGNKAKDIILGHPVTSYTPVYILSTKLIPDNLLEENENEVTFEVSVSNIEQVNEIWIEIRKPDSTFSIGTNLSTQQIIKLKNINLALANSKNFYWVKCAEFKDPGKYTIFFYVKDENEIISGFEESYVYKNKNGNQKPGKFELYSPVNLDEPENQGLDEPELTKVILKWEDSSDSKEHELIYKLFLSKSKSFEEESTIIKDQIKHTCKRVDLPQDWDDSNIYWKVRAINNYGLYYETETWRFKTNNPNSPQSLPIVFVQVYDEKSKMPVPQALVTFQSNTNIIELKMNNSGNNIERLENTGIFNVIIYADGYITSQKSVDISDDSKLYLDLPILYKLQKGDIDRNEIIDLKDALICLQLLSGMSVSDYYYDIGVLNNSSVKLVDVIYILQIISEKMDRH